MAGMEHDLAGIEHHGQALARALGVPDHADAAGRRGRRPCFRTRKPASLSAGTH